MTIADLLAQQPPLVGPGVYDCISARLAEQAGFPMAFLSGYCLSASLLGEPDFGLLNQSQVLDAARRICPSVKIPIIVDIDTGYGNAFNVEQTVRELIRAGAAGCFLEDQVWPKRCGHMTRKRVIPVSEYLPKLRAAISARGDAPFHVTARTDARAVEGLDAAIERACRYRDAGADAVFVEAPESREELQLIREKVQGVTLVANMVERGKTPIFSSGTLGSMGYDIIAVPLALLASAAQAQHRVLRQLRADGHTLGAMGDLMTFPELNDLLRLQERYDRELDWLEKDEQGEKK